MAFKVNYGFERAERNRAKIAKKAAKSLARKAHEKSVAGTKDAESRSDPSDARQILPTKPDPVFSSKQPRRHSIE